MAGPRDPFVPTVDGRIYGRGARDMKGGLASAVIAAGGLPCRLPRFRCAIEISATAEEESVPRRRRLGPQNGAGCPSG